ncbi:MAG: hypothetical protein WC325_12370, partial [Candidatus Bathyarchaeia archaeon]
MKTDKKLTFLLIFLLLCMSLVFVPKGFASVFLPTGSTLALPYYGTGISFTADQTFDVAYRETDSNATYPSFWFLTLDGELYGLQTQTANIVVSSLSYSSNVSYSKSGAGTEKFYLTSPPIFVFLDGVLSAEGD